MAGTVFLTGCPFETRRHLSVLVKKYTSERPQEVIKPPLLMWAVEISVMAHLE